MLKPINRKNKLFWGSSEALFIFSSQSSTVDRSTKNWATSENHVNGPFTRPATTTTTLNHLVFNTNQPSHGSTFMEQVTMANTAAQSVSFALYQAIQNTNASLSHNLLLVSYKKQNKERGGLLFLFVPKQWTRQRAHTHTPTHRPTNK